MEKYKIYCTGEQTAKAFGLGAPIEYAKVIDTMSGKSIRIPANNGDFYCIPTAEEMINWLENKGLLISTTALNTPDNPIYDYSINSEESWTTFSSRKEATLAAIDAALDYLEEQKEDK